MGYYTLAFMNLGFSIIQLTLWNVNQSAKLSLVGGCFNFILSAVYIFLANLEKMNEKNRHLDAVDKFVNLLTAYLSGKILPSDLMLETTGLTWSINHDKKFKRVADALEVLAIQLGNEEITEAEFKAQLLESIKSAK